MVTVLLFFSIADHISTRGWILCTPTGNKWAWWKTHDFMQWPIADRYDMQSSLVIFWDSSSGPHYKRLGKGQTLTLNGSDTFIADKYCSHYDRTAIFLLSNVGLHRINKNAYLL